MSNKTFLTILTLFVFINCSTFAQYDKEFKFQGRTFVHDDGVKRSEVIFIDESRCFITQKYYDPEIAKIYSIHADFNYTKKWVRDKVKGPNGETICHYEITMYPCERNQIKESNEPYIKLSDYAIQRLNFSFGNPYRNDYYPDGERKECFFRIDDRWDYTPVKERDGYIINPYSIQKSVLYRIPDGNLIHHILGFNDAPSKYPSVVSTDNRQKDRPESSASDCSLAGKTYVILDPYRMERFAFINNNTCIYSQFIPMRGDTIEVIQSCKYKQDGCFVSLTPYSCTLTDSLICAMKDNEDVCVGCGKEGVRCFPASYVHFVNVIESDTLVIKKGVLFYSKVFHFPDHNPIHFYRAYYPMNGDIYRLDDNPNNFFSTPGKCPINFGNARVPTNK